MQVEYARKFQKDVERIRRPELLMRINAAVAEVREAATLAEVRQVKRIEGAKSFYRIRVGDYRIGFELIGDLVRFRRCLDRKEIYRYFP